MLVWKTINEGGFCFAKILKNDFYLMLNVLPILCNIKYHSHVWCIVWRSSGQHWPDSSNLNKCVDQNCLFCKNWIVFVIKLWLESCSFPNYPSATIFTPALNPANAILNTTKSWSRGVSQPKCTFWVSLLFSSTKIIFTCL